MLEGLDAIDWSALTHAYGPAADVPELLRSLLSTDANEREQAFYELFGNMWHQGTVYPAAAAAVPFLDELLRTPDVPDKPGIACLLACIADGSGYFQVHAALDLGGPRWERILAEQGRTLQQELAEEAETVAAVRQVVSPILPHLVQYLYDPDTEVRRSVALAFANYPEHAALSMPALKDMLRTETNEEVLEDVRESLDRLAGSSVNSVEPEALQLHLDLFTE
jgi:hypothetical protein